METIKEARDYLAGRMAKGATCPCCSQFVKLYTRKLNRPMVKALAAIYQYKVRHEPVGGWVHIPTQLPELQRSRDYPKLAYWKLLEDKPSDDFKKKNSSGCWRVTKRGVDFLTGRITIPLIAYLYNKQCYGYSSAVAAITKDFKDFDFSETMRKTRSI